MFFKDTIDLIDTTIDYTTPFPSKQETKREVFANVRSATRQEYSATDAQGDRTLFVFEVREGEYNNEECAHYNGNRYYIYRTYEKGFLTELYASNQKVGGSS